MTLRIFVSALAVGLLAFETASGAAPRSTPHAPALGDVVGKAAVGKPAPDFALTAQDGRLIRLSQFRGNWIVLYFYPKDFTKGCTIEAHNFQRDLKQYRDRKAVVLGVSVQSPGSHKDFCAKEGIAFQLLADTDQKISAAYDALMKFNGIALSARRTYLIDPKGVIRKAFSMVDPESHSQEVLVALDQLRKPGAQ